MSGVRRDNLITPATPSDVFVSMKRVWPIALAQLDPGTTPSSETLCVLLAQWALETGRGAAMHNYNIGNIKRAPSDVTHDFTFFACSEIVDGKTVWIMPDDPGCCFRAYPDLDAGVSDYLATIRSRFRAAWPAAMSGDPESFAHMLKLSHYYTASESAYASGLRARFNEFAATTNVLPIDAYSLRGAQQMLQLLGFYKGAIDGEWGPLSRAAMVAFQKRRLLSPSGVASTESIIALAKMVKSSMSAPS